jgi:hypothetical protein
MGLSARIARVVKGGTPFFGGFHAFVLHRVPLGNIMQSILIVARLRKSIQYWQVGDGLVEGYFFGMGSRMKGRRRGDGERGEFRMQPDDVWYAASDRDEAYPPLRDAVIRKIHDFGPKRVQRQLVVYVVKYELRCVSDWNFRSRHTRHVFHDDPVGAQGVCNFNRLYDELVSLVSGGARSIVHGSMNAPHAIRGHALAWRRHEQVSWPLAVQLLLHKVYECVFLGGYVAFENFGLGKIEAQLLTPIRKKLTRAQQWYA